MRGFKLNPFTRELGNCSKPDSQLSSFKYWTRSTLGLLRFHRRVQSPNTCIATESCCCIFYSNTSKERAEMRLNFQWSNTIQSLPICKDESHPACRTKGLPA